MLNDTATFDLRVTKDQTASSDACSLSFLMVLLVVCAVIAARKSGKENMR